MKKITSTPNSEIKELIDNLEERLKKHLKWEFMVAESSMRRDWANDIKKEVAAKFEEQSEELTAIKLEIMGELEKIRKEQIILSSQHKRVLDLEEKMEKLESVHPKFSHAAI